MIGKLLSLAGMMGMSLLCILFGHKWRRKMAYMRIAHGCPVCGGQKFVPYYPKDSTVPSYRKCEACDGTGKNPDDPPPTPPEDMKGRAKKKWMKAQVRKEREQEASWRKRGGRMVKVVWPNCVRCGAKNPNWKDTEHTQRDGDDGLLWRFVKWLIKKMIGE